VFEAAARRDRRVWGSHESDKYRQKHREVILCRGWQVVSACLAGNFLAAVDDVIVATGNSGPTTKQCSAGKEVHDPDRNRRRSLLPRQRIWIFRAMALHRFGDSQAFAETMHDRTF
jgi:hypothetical protein